MASLFNITNRSKSNALKFMTFNIRREKQETTSGQPPDAPAGMTFNDKESPGHEQPWRVRKWKIADTILLHSPDIVGLQEPFRDQLQDLESLLHDEYDWLGKGREDGKEKGEFCPVFYKRDCISVDGDYETIWLSETPEVAGSKSWEARYPRIATLVKFKRTSGGETFTVINTHLDHCSAMAREEASKIILKRARTLAEIVVLLGDLNSSEDECAYQTLTASRYKDQHDANNTLKQLSALEEKSNASFARATGRPIRTTEGISLPTHRVIRKADLMGRDQQQQNTDQQDPPFLDARYELSTRLSDGSAFAPLSGPYGFKDTYTGFGQAGSEDEAPKRIDYIMLMKNSTEITVRQFAVLSNQFDGLYISDHRPVVAKLEW